MKIAIGILLGGAFLLAGPAPGPANRFVVIAHRGAHVHAHENTLEAIEAAIRVGADYVEVDVRQTADGRLVLLHDATVDRVTDGRGRLDQLEWDEVRRLVVRDPARPELPPSRVPTFSAALARMRGRIRLYLDFKAGDRARAVAALRRHQMLTRTVVYDDPRAFARWRELAPGLALMCSLPETARNEAGARAFLRAFHPTVLDGGVDDYNAALVRAIQATGTPVWPDIQGPDESPARWQAACKLGITGLQTDHPAALIAWLRSTGRR